MRSPLVAMTQYPSPPGTCPVTVSSGDSRYMIHRACARKLKAERPVVVVMGDAEVMVEVCGMHVGVYDRAAAKDQALADEQASAKALLVAMRRKVLILTGRFGIEFQIDRAMDPRTYVSHPTGKVLVDADALLEASEGVT